MKFPHISRFFSASLLLGLGVLLSLNILLLGKRSRDPYQLAVLKAPWSPTTHEQLARQYWQGGKIPQAVSELKLASVLGTTTYADQITRWESERVQKEAALAYWRAVAEKHSNYRDAFVILASLAYELGRFDEARKYLTRAESLDPYAKSIDNLKTILR
ncbi:tetratricopeptide repeat protein [Candidatus Gottesmanbacteria bacterium]|nr:tetratricopeptide repeat protein [Candidatus Gottesmanbacteria bacterium]